MRKLCGLMLTVILTLCPLLGWAVDAKISADSTKVTPVVGDLIPGLNSAASNANIKMTLGSLPVSTAVTTLLGGVNIPSGTEFSYVKGVTSAIQTQLGNKIETSTKGAASGVASLNVSTKVVEDPANATATATASKIPIADGSGKLDTWITTPLYPTGSAAGLTSFPTLNQDTTGLSGGITGTPGNSKYYGTNSIGTKGFYDLPTGGGVPTSITIADEPTDTSCYVGFFTGVSGDLGPKTNTGLTFNAATGMLTATGLTGPLTGNASTATSATSATTATNATNVTTASETTDTTCFPLFVTSDTPGNLPPKIDAGISYNSNTHALTATTFVGALTGNASTATSATTATTGTNATNTAITDDTTTAATMYPTWVTAVTGNLPQKTTSSKLTFNPSTGMLSSTGFTGALTGAASSNILTTAKGAASGVASLNASTLVVENPANATATPTASKIPIADGSGKLDGWITAAGVPTTITVADGPGTDATCFLPYFSAVSGNLGPKTSPNLTFDEITDTLGVGLVTILPDGKIKLSGTTKIDLAVAAGDLAVGTGLTISAGSGTGAVANAGATVGVATNYAIPHYVTFTTGGTTNREFTLPDAAATLLYSGGALGTPSGGTLSNCTGTPLISPKVGTITDAATIYPSSDGTNTGTKVNHFTVTACAQATAFGTPPGSWNDGDKLTIRIYSAAARALDFTTATSYVPRGQALLTTTAAGKYSYAGYIYNGQASKFDCVATSQEQ